MKAKLLAPCLITLLTVSACGDSTKVISPTANDASADVSADSRPDSSRLVDVFRDFVQPIAARPDQTGDAGTLLNADFESVNEGWTQCAEGHAQSSSDAFDGQSALQLNSNSCVYQTISIAADQTYSLSCQVKLTEPSLWTGLGIEFADQNFQSLSKSPTASATSGSYQQLITSATAPANAQIASIWFYSDNGALLDNCELIQGNAPDATAPAAGENMLLNPTFTTLSETGGPVDWASGCDGRATISSSGISLESSVCVDQALTPGALQAIRTQGASLRCGVEAASGESSVRVFLNNVLYDAKAVTSADAGSEVTLDIDPIAAQNGFVSLYSANSMSLSNCSLTPGVSGQMTDTPDNDAGDASGDMAGDEGNDAGSEDNTGNDVPATGNEDPTDEVDQAPDSGQGDTGEDTNTGADSGNAGDGAETPDTGTGNGADSTDTNDGAEQDSDTGGDGANPPTGTPDTGPDTNPGSDAGSGTDTTPDTDPGTDPDGSPNTGSEAGTDSGTDNEPDTNPDTGSDTGPDTGSDTGPDTGSDTGPDTGSDTGPDTGSDTGPDTGSDTGPDTGSDTGSGENTGGNPDADQTGGDTPGDQTPDGETEGGDTGENNQEPDPEPTEETDTTAPSWADDTLTVSDVTSTSLVFQWSPANDDTGIAQYLVSIAGAGQVGQFSTSETTVKLTSLQPDTVYTANIQAVDSAGNLSSNQLTGSGTTAPAAPPEPPADTSAPSWQSAQLNVDNSVPGTLALTWSGASDDVGIVAYRVTYNGESVNVAGTSVTLADLAENTPYLITVQAVDAAGNVSNNGPATTVSTTSSADTMPPFWLNGTLLFSEQSHSSIKLDWAGASDNVGVVGYQVTYNGTTINVQDTSVTISALEAETEYSVSVQALDAAGNVSVNGPTGTGATTSLPQPAVPTWSNGSVSVTDATPTSLTLNWTGASDDIGIAGYLVDYNGTLEVVTDTTITLTGLIENSAYTVVIQAVDGDGNVSKDGPSVVAQTIASEPQPEPEPVTDTAAPVWGEDASVTVNSTTQTTVSLLWNGATDTSGVASYTVAFVGDNQIRSVESVMPMAELTGLTPGSTYLITIQATDSAGNVSRDGPSIIIQTAAALPTPPASPGGN